MPKDTFFNLPEGKRTRIADLAIEEFSEHPYKQASISKICMRAGIAKGSFYQYFENKLDLYRWLLFTVARDLKMEALRAHPAPDGQGFFAEFEHIFYVGLKFGLSHPRIARIAARFSSATSSDPGLAAMIADFKDMQRRGYRHMLEQARDAGELKPSLDLDVATDVLRAVSQHAIDNAIERHLGGHLLEFCARPELAAQFDDNAQRALIREVVSVLASGLGSATTTHVPGHVIDFEQER